MSTMKKMIVGILVTGLIGGGVWIGSQVSFASESSDPPKGVSMMQMNKEKRGEQMATKVATYLGISKDEVMKLMESEQLPPRQIAVASVIAKKSKQTLPQIIKEKQLDMTWEKVADKYKITHVEIKKEVRRIFPKMNQQMNRNHHSMDHCDDCKGKKSGKHQCPNK